MSTEKIIEKTTTFSLKSKLADYASLGKLRLASLVVYSAGLGYGLGLLNSDTKYFDWETFIYLLLGGLLVTASSNGYNQVIERESDKKMERTKNRPIPAGRMSVTEGIIVSTILGIIGSYLLIQINYLSFALGLIALVSYVAIYTPLKKITPISVFVGAFPGSIPPMIGYIAATGEFGFEPGIIFLVQFVWQFPHFWAIAWKGSEDYAKGGYRMLPFGDDKDKRTKLIAEQIELERQVGLIRKGNWLYDEQKQPISEKQLQTRLDGIKLEIAELDKLKESRMNSLGLTDEELEEIANKYKKFNGGEVETPLTKDELKQLKKAQDNIAELEQEAVIRRMDSDVAELQRIRDNYAEKIEQAKGFDAEVKKLEDLRDEELADKEAEIKQRKDEEYEAAIHSIESKLLSQKELELQSLEEKYLELETAAEGNKDRLAEIEDLKGKELSKIQDKWAKKEAKVLSQENISKIRSAHTLETAKFSAAKEGFALLKSLDAEKKAAYKVFFAAEKASAIAEIYINLQKEIAELKVLYPGPLSTPFVTSATIRAYASMGGVAAQAIPVFRKGGLLKGPSHESSGLDVINPQTGQKVLEMEGDEVVLSKKTVAKNPEIVHELLQASLYRDGETDIEFLRPELPTQIIEFRNGGALKPVNILPTAPAGPKQEEIGDEVISEAPETDASKELLIITLNQLLERLEQPFYARYGDKEINKITKQQSLFKKIKR